MSSISTSPLRAALPAALAFSMAVAASLEADTVSFASTPAGNLPSGTVFVSDDGVDVTVFANEVDGQGENAPFDVGDDLMIRQNAQGIGVDGGPVEGSNSLRRQLDGVGSDEVLQFLFPMSVKLTKVFFSRANPGDEFDFAISADGQSITARDVFVNTSLGDDEIVSLGVEQPTGVNVYAVEFPAELRFAGGTDFESGAGKLFQFHTNEADDDFAILKVEFEEEDELGNNEVIPEPATALLLIVGLAAAAPRRR